MRNRFYFLCSFLLIISFVHAQNVFTVKPYLQIGKNSDSRSLQILWQVPAADAVWMLEYKNEGTANWMKSSAINFTEVAVTGNPAHRVYHATLNGLTPGTKFQYRLLKNGVSVFTGEAKANKGTDQPYRFVAIGDIGAETPDQKALAGRIFKENPDFVVVPGDIVYEKGLVSEYTKKFWPVYNNDVSDASGAPIMRSVPFIAAVGNHDADSRDLDKTPDALAYYMYWDQPLNGPLGKEGGSMVPVLKGSDANKKAFLTAAGETYPRMANFSFNYGNSHWTVLDADTYVDWTDTALVNWVKNDLASSKDAVWHFVLYHHPGFNSSIDHYEQQHMRLLSPVFEAGKVDIVFNGHVHNYQRSYPLRFKPASKGTLMVGGANNQNIRGRVVPGLWTLDKNNDGKNFTNPQGIIYVITGAGGQELYNPEQTADTDSWQKFTYRFVSTVHSLTVADVNGNTVTVRQVTADGRELDSFSITKK